MSSDRFDKIDTGLEKLDDKLDGLSTQVAKLDFHVEKNTEDLEHHIKRTDLNEDRILRLEKIEQWLRGATWITLGISGTVLAAIRYFKS